MSLLGCVNGSKCNACVTHLRPNHISVIKQGYVFFFLSFAPTFIYLRPTLYSNILSNGIAMHYNVVYWQIALDICIYICICHDIQNKRVQGEKAKEREKERDGHMEAYKERERVLRVKQTGEAGRGEPRRGRSRVGEGPAAMDPSLGGQTLIRPR